MSFKFLQAELGVQRASQEERMRTKGMDSENSGVNFEWKVTEDKWLNIKLLPRLYPVAQPLWNSQL